MSLLLYDNSFDSIENCNQPICFQSTFDPKGQDRQHAGCIHQGYHFSVDYAKIGLNLFCQKLIYQHMAKLWHPQPLGFPKLSKLWQPYFQNYQECNDLGYHGDNLDGSSSVHQYLNIDTITPLFNLNLRKYEG